MAGGDGTRRGLLEEVTTFSSRPRRRLAATGAVQASVVFDSAGRAFVADMAGGVQAFAADGPAQWRVKPAGGISATPAVHPNESRLFVGTHAGVVAALDTATGRTLWQHEIPTESDPRILSDLLLLPRANLVVSSGWGGRFHALDATSGAARFSWDAGISPSSAASADGEEHVYCVRAVWDRGSQFVRLGQGGDERVLHQVSEGKRGARRMLVMAPPVVDEARAVVYAVMNPDEGSLVVAWSIREQGVAWTCALPNSVQAAPTLDSRGSLHLPDLAGTVQTVSAAGRLEPQTPLGCEYLLAGGVCEGSDRFYVGDPWGRVHELGASGESRVLFQTPRSLQGRLSFGPDGSLYVPCTDHGVYVFRADSRTRASARLPRTGRS